MAKGLCPKCGAPVHKNYSYCKPCYNEWQNARNKLKPKRPLTPEQKEAALRRERERIARMTPVERQAHNDRKQASRLKWLDSDPSIRNRINETAAKRRTTWTPEKMARIKEIAKSHYARRMLRKEQGLCAYSTQCDQPPIGEHTHCLYHWMQVMCISHTPRSKSDVSIEQLLNLWNSQGGKCAITGLPIIPGKCPPRSQHSGET